jgi:hypothetical protein
VLYAPSYDTDTLLELWFHQLRVSGELEQLYLTDQRHLSFFLRSFQQPVQLVYQLDETPQIVVALWFDPSPAIGAWCGLWVKDGHRTRRATLNFILDTYTAAFETWPILYGLTKQESLLEPHRRLGYTIGPEIPSAFDGHKGWLVTLTKLGFERSLLYERHQRHRRQRRLQHPRATEPAAF